MPAPIGQTSRRNTGHEHDAASAAGCRRGPRSCRRSAQPSRPAARAAIAMRTLTASVTATGSSIATASTVTSGHHASASSAARQRAAALPQRERRLDVAARQAAIEVVEQLDEAAARVDDREDRDRHGGRRAPSGGERPSATTADRAAGRPQPHAQPRRAAARGASAAAARPRARGAAESRNRTRPPRIHPSVEPSEKTPNASGDSRRAATIVIDEQRAFARQIGERFVRDQQRAARFRVSKRCFVHRKRFSLSQAMRGRDDRGICSRRARAFARAAVARILELLLDIRAHTDMVGITFFAGVALLTLVAPFELTAPLAAPAAPVGQQPRSGGVVCVCLRAAPRSSGRAACREWRTPLTLPWVALLARDGRRVGASRRSRASTRST